MLIRTWVWATVWAIRHQTPTSSCLSTVSCKGKTFPVQACANLCRLVQTSVQVVPNGSSQSITARTPYLIYIYYIIIYIYVYMYVYIYRIFILIHHAAAVCHWSAADALLEVQVIWIAWPQLFRSWATHGASCACAHCCSIKIICQKLQNDSKSVKKIQKVSRYWKHLVERDSPFISFMDCSTILCSRIPLIP